MHGQYPVHLFSKSTPGRWSVQLNEEIVHSTALKFKPPLPGQKGNHSGTHHRQRLPQVGKGVGGSVLPRIKTDLGGQKRVKRKTLATP